MGSEPVVERGRIDFQRRPVDQHRGDQPAGGAQLVAQAQVTIGDESRQQVGWGGAAEPIKFAAAPGAVVDIDVQPGLQVPQVAYSEAFDKRDQVATCSDKHVLPVVQFAAGLPVDERKGSTSQGVAGFEQRNPPT